jgi:hypothetical protein
MVPSQTPGRILLASGLADSTQTLILFVYNSLQVLLFSLSLIRTQIISCLFLAPTFVTIHGVSFIQYSLSTDGALQALRAPSYPSRAFFLMMVPALCHLHPSSRGASLPLAIPSRKVNADFLLAKDSRHKLWALTVQVCRVTASLVGILQAIRPRTRGLRRWGQA